MRVEREGDGITGSGVVAVIPGGFRDFCGGKVGVDFVIVEVAVYLAKLSLHLRLLVKQSSYQYEAS